MHIDAGTVLLLVLVAVVLDRWRQANRPKRFR
jgi:hypothetical protein